MEYITSAAKAAEIDRISIKEIGIPSVVLMEKAAMEVADFVKSICDKDRTDVKVLAVCGVGNNGGDGAAAARLLKEAGYDASIFIVGNMDKASEEMHTQINIARSLDVRFITKPNDNEYNIIIDALFGIGLSRDITGEFAECIKWINLQKSQVVAVDVPSGISSDSGKVLGRAVKADYTVTFGYNKTGLLLYPGASYAGNITVADIGFPRKAFEIAAPNIFTYTKEDIYTFMPPRRARTNKGSYGKVLVIAGSDDMSGACYFTAKAAYRMGCGLVYAATSEKNKELIKLKLPEAITMSYENGIEDALKMADVIAVGPGLGMSALSKKLVERVIAVDDKPVVMDADALNIYAELKGHAENINLGDNFVITPHLKEMSRLTKSSVDDIKDNIIKYCGIQSNGCTIVLKDARTVVSNGDKYYINTTGSNALAKGGSGDVLCGMIAGLIAQDMEIFEAACLAVCIHGITADTYTNDRSKYAMLASDIIEILPEVLP